VRALPSAAGPTTVLRVDRRLNDELLVKSNIEGEPDTKLVCGRLRFEHAHDNMVLVALPPVVVLQAAGGPDAARLLRIVETIQPSSRTTGSVPRSSQRVSRRHS
jgi:AraC family transcriptional regulator, activator of mtrCDE